MAQSIGGRVMDMKIEQNTDDIIEIDDTDDEHEETPSGMHASSETNGDRLDSNGSRSRRSGTESSDDGNIHIDLITDNDVDMKHEAKVEIRK